MNQARLYLYFALRAARFRLQQVRPPKYGSAKVVGPNPLRVLLVGAGLLAGYGVREHADAVAGPLASGLASRLGRGVVVDCRVTALLPMRDALDFIGANGSHTYDAVVFAPCFLEGQLPPSPRIRTRLRDVLRHLTSTGRDGLALLLLTVPEPVSASRLDVAAASAARQQAQMMRALTRTDASTRVVDAPPFDSVTDRVPFDTAYYQRTAHALAGELATLLTPTSRSA